MNCPAPERIVEKIYNCGRNSAAVEIANACRAAIEREAAKSGKALSELMSQLGSEMAGGQDAALAGAGDRLDRAIENLTTRIEDLQKNADTIASYTTAMIDWPGARDDSESLDCFSTNFHALQGVVIDLDHKIVAAKTVRTRALGFASTLGGRTGKLRGLGGRAAAGGRGTGAGAPSSGARAPSSTSDITGLPPADASP